MFGFLRSTVPVAVALLVLAGCAPRQAEERIAVAAPPPPPMLPDGITATLPVPEVGADGAYVTINHGLDPAEAVWHVRSALNVAALACRGPQDGTITTDYNAMLGGQRAELARTLRAVESRYRAAGGTDWRSAQDAHMTRVYNFFAQPPAQQRFCTVAAAVAAEAAQLPPGDLTAFALAALPRLEAPFTDIYRIVDNYRRDLAAWHARYAPAGPPVVTASR